MRVILQAIFLLLILLVYIEDFILHLISLAKKTQRKVKRNFQMLRKSIKKTSNTSILAFQSFLNQITTPLLQRKKNSGKKVKGRKKGNITPTAPLLFAFRLKLKYFLFGVLFSFFFLFLPLCTVILLQDMPNPEELTLRQSPQTTKIYDRNGILLAEIYASQNRTIIPLSKVPKYLQEATLAIEDKNFYNHPGFDIPSIMRAFRKNITGGNIQGGSTLTQQLIKSSILTPERSITRKIKEIVLAFWAERIYTKKQILEMYFNQVPYGGTAWGVEAASEVYLNKPVQGLDLAESAFLAGLTAAPTSYSPFGANPTLWKKRQKEVLNRMIALGYITKTQAKQAADESISFNDKQDTIRAPHFVAYIEDLIAQKYGVGLLEKGGLSVITSLDIDIQDMAQKAVTEEVANSSYLNLSNGAALVTNPANGDILAMVGSHDYNDPNGGKVNITTSFRQPGSTVKVITYSAALSHGFTPATIIDDSPVSFTYADAPAYTPVNYDGKFHGKIPLRLALANSLNVPAVKTLDKIGVPTMVNLGERMGIDSWGEPKSYGLSVTLGGAEVTMLDMATVNGTLANSGERVDLNPILKITDYKGTIYEEKKNPSKVQVLDKGVAFIISDILADNQARAMEFGPNSPLLIPNHTVSVKTGTTDNKRDNWTNGYTNNYVVITWVGNNDNSPMDPSLASGITGAAPIWHRIMSTLLTSHPETKLSIPDEVIAKSCLGRQEYFIKGTENSVNCGSFPYPLGLNPTDAQDIKQNTDYAKTPLGD